MAIHASAPNSALHAQPALNVHSASAPLHVSAAAVGVLHSAATLHSQVAAPISSLHPPVGGFHIEAPVGGQVIQSHVAPAMWAQNTGNPALPDVSHFYVHFNKTCVPVPVSEVYRRDLLKN
jgi:hypothetical protein